MRATRSLALLGLLSLAACGDDVSARELADRARGAASDAVERLQEIDLSELAPDALKEKGGEIVRAVARRIEEIEDSDTARRVRESLVPLVEKAARAKDRLGEELPSTQELRDSASRLKERFPNGSEVREALQPLLDRIEALLG